MILNVTTLVKLYNIPVLNRFAKGINLLLGVDIPRRVKIGKGVVFPHNSVGTVIHDNTIIEDDVKIYQNVTIGRGDIYKAEKNTKLKGFRLKKGCCICAGAKIICSEGELEVGEYSVIAANAVLLNSTGPYEIWGGVPAKLIGYRDDIGEKD